MTDDLVAFLNARLDEDEQIARAVDDNSAPWPGQWENDGDTALRTRNGWVLARRGGDPFRAGLLDHIARHDPARVLAEVDAKRRIMKEALHYAAMVDGEWGCCHGVEAIESGACPEQQPSDLPTLRLLALSYADHPNYREEWRP